MKRGFTIGGFRNRHGRLLRAVAVFFLLYTGADLTLPQYFCGEEVGGMSLTSLIADKTVQRDGATTRLTSAPEAPRPDAPTDQAPHDEDCFCCCVHVLPALPVTRVGGSEIKSPPALRELKSFPTPPLGNTFRPPRSA